MVVRDDPRYLPRRGTAGVASGGEVGGGVGSDALSTGAVSASVGVPW